MLTIVVFLRIVDTIPPQTDGVTIRAIYNEAKENRKEKNNEQAKKKEAHTKLHPTISITCAKLWHAVDQRTICEWLLMIRHKSYITCQQWWNIHNLLKKHYTTLRCYVLSYHHNLSMFKIIFIPFWLPVWHSNMRMSNGKKVAVLDNNMWKVLEMHARKLSETRTQCEKSVYLRFSWHITLAPSPSPPFHLLK